MSKLEKYLEQYWNSKAFRPLQQEIIEHYLSGKDTLVLLPTGGGKSICYQLPALLKKGQTLVISPLISLMQDQVDQLNRRGIKSMFFESGRNKNDIFRQLENARNGEYKLIYCSPERLTDEEFMSQLKMLSIDGIAIDEAHCISEWGHDFRPAFKTIKFLRKIFPKAPFMALTASATPKVLKDIEVELELLSAKTFKTSFERKNIHYQLKFTEDKMGELKKILKPGEPTIVYCRSRSKSESTAHQIQRWGLQADFYHGGIESRQKKQKLNDWKNEKKTIMVATSAFGMGIDKSNVRKVIHLIMPESMESYYQETGRAGRDGLDAQALLLVHPADSDQLKNQFLENLPDAQFLKSFFKNLCNYLNIALGKGEGQSHRLEFKDFCDTYRLPSKKTFNAFGILDREGVFEWKSTHETQTYLKINCSPKAASERSEQRDPAGRILQFVMRNYPEIFRKSKKINLGQISDLLQMDFELIHKKLVLLEKENIIELKKGNTDTQLFWKVPREDRYTLAPFMKRTVDHHQRKADKITFMLDYAFENSECKRNKILRYFGEKKTDLCQKCSAKSCRKNNRPDHDVAANIKKLIAKEPLSARQIAVKLETTNEHIVLALHQMLEDRIIGLNQTNQFYLK